MDHSQDVVGIAMICVERRINAIRPKTLLCQLVQHTSQEHSPGVHLLRSQLRMRSEVALKCAGFSCTRSRMMVVNREELVSVSAVGPLNSIDRSID
jgi:hypothetical protein